MACSSRESGDPTQAVGFLVNLRALVANGPWKKLQATPVGRQFAREVGLLTAANFVEAAVSFVQGLLVARWLGPDLYGVAALVMSFPSLVHTFFDARSVEASVKYLSEFHARGERNRALAMCKLGYSVDFAIASLAFLVILLTANWAARRIAQRPETLWLIVLYAAAFLPRALVGTSYAVLATLGRFSIIAVVNILTSLLRMGLILGLVLLGWQVAGVVWGNAVAMAAAGLLYGIITYGLVRRTWNASWLAGRWHTLKGHRRSILGFLAYNDFNVLLGMIPKQLDTVLLGYFRNPTEAGYYKLAKSTVSAAGYLVVSLQSVVYPELSRLWSLGDTTALRQKVRELALQVGLPLGFAVLAGASFIPFVLPALVGSAYQPAVVAAQLLFVGSAVWTTFFWLRPLYLAQGAVREWTGISVAVVCLSITGFLLVVPLWGYKGLAAWLMLMNLFGSLVAAIYLRRRDQSYE